MTDELEAIEPSTRTVTFNGERLELQPLKVGTIPKVVRLARPVINRILDLDALPDQDDGKMVDLALDLIQEHGADLFKAVGIAIKREPDWVEEGDISEFIELCRALYEVNRDFFVRHLAPLFAKARQVNGAGKTPSSS